MKKKGMINFKNLEINLKSIIVKDKKNNTEQEIIIKKEVE